MKEIQYPAKITQDGDDYLVQFIDLDEAHTYGKTLEEALYNAAEVLSLTLAGRMEEEQPLPKPSNLGDENYYWVPPLADVQAALLLHGAMQENSMSISALARALNTSWSSAQGLVRPGTNITLGRLQKAADTLGKRLVLRLDP